MRHLLAIILALLLASLCADALRAQGVTKIPLSSPGTYWRAKLIGQQEGVLVHGYVDTGRVVPVSPTDNRYEGFRFPFVFECNSTGRTGEVLTIPDTGRWDGYKYVTNTVEMTTAALRDGPTRIMVAWSSQKRYSPGYGYSLQLPTLTLGMFDRGVFHLLARYPGGSNPQLLRDRAGVAHLLWVRQKPIDAQGNTYVDYRGEVQYASFRNGVMETAPMDLGSGVHLSAVLDPSGTVHILTTEYDSLPTPLNRVKHLAGSGASWGSWTTLTELPAWPLPPFDLLPSSQFMPKVLAFAADGNGVARVVLRQLFEDRGIILALSSNGGRAVIDSLRGLVISGVASSIDANGTITCVFDATGYRQPPLHSWDTLYVCTVDPALAATNMEVLAADTVTVSNLKLLQSKRDGVCLFYTQEGGRSWYYTRLGTGPRPPQPLMDGYALIGPDSPGASDSTGAMWIEYWDPHNGTFTPTWLLRIPPGAVPVARVDAPAAFALQCFPNPTTTDATIRFSLSTEERVTITVHDMLGREVLRVADGEGLAPGTHTRSLRLEGLPRGAYGVRLRASDATTATTILVH